jgi:hypothetical protein
MKQADVKRIAAAVADWASNLPGISALAIIGSWARGGASPSSDLDLLMIAEQPHLLQGNRDWPAAIDWRGAGFALKDWEDVSYGAVWSRHVELSPNARVELSFASPSWAATDPIDSGTLEVVRGGCQILLDKGGILSALLAATNAGRRGSRATTHLQ